MPSKKRAKSVHTKMLDRKDLAKMTSKQRGSVLGEATLVDFERQGLKSARASRVHYEHPHIKVNDQSAGFEQVLIRLYELEDELSPVGPCNKMFAEARAICEVFLPPFMVQRLRRNYDEDKGG